jgi:hypothetical protein
MIFAFPSIKMKFPAAVCCLWNDFDLICDKCAMLCILRTYDAYVRIHRGGLTIVPIVPWDPHAHLPAFFRTDDYHEVRGPPLMKLIMCCLAFSYNDKCLWLDLKYSKSLRKSTQFTYYSSQ